jgi:hypothetical protein
MASGQILWDSFGGTGAALAGHLSDNSATWQPLSENLGLAYVTAVHTIRSNSANQAMYYATAQTNPAAEATGILRVWDTSVTGAAAGFILGRSSSGNFYLGRYNQATGKFEIYKAVGNAYTLLNSAYYNSTALPVGTGYIKFNVDVAGHSQNLYYSLDGNSWTLVCAATDTAITGYGSVGIQLYGAMSDASGVHLAQMSITCGTFPNPGFMKVSGVTSSSATIQGTAPTGGTASFSIQYQRAQDSAGSPGTWSNAGSAYAGLASGTAPGAFTDNGLAAGTYWYRTVATDAASNVAYSAGVQVTIGSTAISAGALSTTTVTPYAIALAWPSASGGTSPYTYDVKRSTSLSMSAATALVSGQAGLTYSDTTAGMLLLSPARAYEDFVKNLLPVLA